MSDRDTASIVDRDPKYKTTDARVVRAIAQTAINVELFTIPLYMTALYSIEGMHPITGKGNAFYKNRLWPGAKPSFRPTTKNQEAFNIIFSVFIQEMLHLQMAANMATAIGASPCFTSSALQNPDHGWTCYGPTNTVIPAIVNLTDTDRFADVVVNAGALDENSIRLFLAIELPQDQAEADIVKNRDQYFPTVPFDGGDVNWDPANMKMFGSIGYMYQCYRDYLNIRYSDGTRLWDFVFNPNGQQNDLFNNFSFPGHPMREFMGVETTIALTDKEIALAQVLEMMNAITDQGEGSTLKARMARASAAGLLQGPVMDRYRPSDVALRSDYPNYSDTGQQIPSADAHARFENDKIDHYERFERVQALLGLCDPVVGDFDANLYEGKLTTWQGNPKVGHWTADDLKTATYDPSDNVYGIPSPEEVAASLNAINTPDYHIILSKAVVGAIKGVTTVLDSYWNPTSSGATVGFPFPSMVGSGDRMSICWAATGKSPDLSQGIGDPSSMKLYHACQGLDLSQTGNSCAAVEIFHTCRGSNGCKAHGGCGFVQPSTGGGSCGSGGGSCGATATKGASSCGATATKGGGCSAVRMRTQGGLCGGPTPQPSGQTYTAPSDNICAGFGGCAVPISASQVYPSTGTMDVYDIPAPMLCGKTPPSTKIGTITFKEGDKVEDIAYQAFAKVLQHRNKPVPPQAVPNDLRKAFPPST